MTNLVRAPKSSVPRSSRLAFALLQLNVVLLLVGALNLAWQSTRAAAYQPMPTTFAHAAASSTPGSC